MTRSLPLQLQALILDEQVRQSGQFIVGVDVDAYLAKLADKAEILSDWADGRYRGFVAFYCNDQATRAAFITLVLVDPRDRGTGLGRTLVDCVLTLARQRGFTTCRLEVAKSNHAAYAMYLAQGFRVVEQRTHNDLLEIVL